MKTRLRDRMSALLGVTVLLALVLASYYYALRGEIAARRGGAGDTVPEYRARDLSVTEFDRDGLPKQRAVASYLERYDDGRIRSLDPRLSTLSADSPLTRASADRGDSDDDGKTTLFSGNVVITRAGDLERAPLRFTSDHITVYPDDSRMETDAVVRVESGNDVTVGRGMTYDEVDRKVRLLADVRSVFMPRPRESAAPRLTE